MPRREPVSAIAAIPFGRDDVERAALARGVVILAVACVIAPLSSLLLSIVNVSFAIEVGVRLVAPALICVACMFIADAPALALSGGELVRRRLRFAGVLAIASPFVAFVVPVASDEIGVLQIFAGIASAVLAATSTIVVGSVVGRLLAPRLAGRAVLLGVIAFVVAAIAIVLCPPLRMALSSAIAMPELEFAEYGSASASTAAIAFMARAIQLVITWGADVVTVLGCSAVLARVARERAEQ